jgi:hypothetical protein
MLRNVIAVVAGYATMFVGVFVTFSVAYMAMGADGAFAPGTYNASTQWIITSMVLGFVAALAGGLVCAGIARPCSRASQALAAVVLVLGLLMAIPVVMGAGEERGQRTADVGNVEAMKNARTPVLVAFLNPIIGAGGVMIGSRLLRKESAKAGVREDRSEA